MRQQWREDLRICRNVNGHSNGEARQGTLSALAESVFDLSAYFGEEPVHSWVPLKNASAIPAACVGSARVAGCAHCAGLADASSTTVLITDAVAAIACAPCTGTVAAPRFPALRPCGQSRPEPRVT